MRRPGSTTNAPRPPAARPVVVRAFAECRLRHPATKTATPATGCNDDGLRRAGGYTAFKYFQHPPRRPSVTDPTPADAAFFAGVLRVNESRADRSIEQMASALKVTPELLQRLFVAQGPSLGLWRAAEIAVLRENDYARPIVDLGCGDGQVTRQVLPRVEYGVDPYRPALVRAAELGLYERLIDRPIEAAPIPAHRIGSVVSNSVLEHLPQPEKILRAVAHLLRPGGRLIYTVPTEAFGRWLLLPSERYANWRNAHYEHRNLWPLERWIWQLDCAGFSVERVRSYFPRPLVSWWDALELSQRVWIGRRRLFSLAWQRLPASALRWLAQRAARLDLSAPPPGGGRLIVARRR